MGLEVEDVINRCRAALDEHTPQLAVRDVLDELIADPSALEKAVGPVDQGGIQPLHNSDDLTILRVAWTPGMVLNPHEHRMWAVIGMYGGDFFTGERSEWDFDTFDERPRDLDRTMRLFEEANARWRATA